MLFWSLLGDPGNFASLKKKTEFSNNLNTIWKLFFPINSKVFDRSFEELRRNIGKSFEELRRNLRTFWTLLSNLRTKFKRTYEGKLRRTWQKLRRNLRSSWPSSSKYWNDNASYFIELTFSTLYSFFLSCLCFLWPAPFLSKIINMGASPPPPPCLSMQPWWWVMMQPASVSRQKVSVLTSHSLIAWITIWTYHLDSNLRRRVFVHLLAASWLPDACCFIFLAIVCIFSLSHITKFLSWLYNCWLD
jgi:hypothetical protein